MLVCRASDSEPDLDWRKIEKDLLAARGSEDCDGTFSYVL